MQSCIGKHHSACISEFEVLELVQCDILVIGHMSLAAEHNGIQNSKLYSVLCSKRP